MGELVSIKMLAYNQVNWVEQAIRSILNQKTEYSYKLYIHDDASNDGTDEVIKQYATVYPDKIEAILETENQYSKGVSIGRTILNPRVKGKYIASCEGDDYWIDELKLQKQVEYMEQNPKCTLSFGNAMIVDTNDKKVSPFFPKRYWNDPIIDKKLKSKNGADFSIEEMIILDFVPTASLMYRREACDLMKQYDKSLDLLVRLVSTSMGYAHYHNEIFSAYRRGNLNSASGSIKDSLEKKIVNYYELHRSLLETFDEKNNFKYHETIIHEIDRKEVETYFNFDPKTTKALKCYKELTLYSKLKLFFNENVEELYKVLRAYKYRNTTLK